MQRRWQPGEKLYRATLEKWGEEAQYDQAIEECAELIAGLKHFKRNKVAAAQVVDELADVTLMIGQLTWMFGAEQVEAAIARKLEKLGNLLAADAGGGEDHELKERKE